MTSCLPGSRQRRCSYPIASGRAVPQAIERFLPEYDLYDAIVMAQLWIILFESRNSKLASSNAVALATNHLPINFHNDSVSTSI